ncbi:60 kDa heat shock protein, mitochondrial [Perkinsus olseni]|uniref:60 kDa heat shock protein, mitochondrial n=1 Tax=Perkinsus olseni TaxID=32597 RepID=A0A7J6LGZ3_PEROL|nr:60 kDa heat shock protein, mitochondrial [Perkinsus olseni]
MGVAKEVLHGAEARSRMLVGVNRIADAVAVTMGPKGRNVVIEQSFGSPKVTKDGVTVAKAIDLPDKMQNVGAALIKQVASKTNDIAGDGTTTSTVLARAIFREGCKAVAAGMNPMDLKRGIDAAVKLVMDELKTRAQAISTAQEIQQVATIAANGDKTIGSLIAEAFEKVGKDGTITVSDGKTMDHQLEVVEGMQFNRGYISPYFITNNKTQSVEFENPLILVHEKKISSIQSILPVLEYVVKLQRPLLIIAEDVDGEALATLVVNKLRGGLKVCAVKAPGFGDNRKAQMQDIATVCGCEVISEETGTKLSEDFDPALLGSCKSVSVKKDDTIILDGAGAREEIDERCETLRDAIDNTSSEYEKDKLKERLAKMSGGVAVIKVGGSSELEVSEVKDRLNDALNATKAAVEEGIVPGGGSALLRASKKLEDLKLDNFDQEVGCNIIRSACKQPCKTIVENAGEEGAVVVQKLLSDDHYHKGYNAQTSEYVDMLQQGIVDPTKVVRTALADAASIASLMTTTETVICDLPEKEKAPAAPDMNGMGGMGGMGVQGDCQQDEDVDDRSDYVRLECFRPLLTRAPVDTWQSFLRPLRVELSRKFGRDRSLPSLCVSSFGLPSW